MRVATIMRAFRALRQKHTLVVVEGVGGVHVPITSSLNVSDIIYRMKLPAIVVGRSSLGGNQSHVVDPSRAPPAKDSHRGVGLESASTSAYEDRSSAGTIDRESSSTPREGSRGGPPPLQPERESKLERRFGPPRGDRSDHEAGEAGPSPHYS